MFENSNDFAIIKKNGRVNLRNKPTSQASEIIGSLDVVPEDVSEIVGKQWNSAENVYWYFIVLRGKSGWVNASVVRIGGKDCGNIPDIVDDNLPITPTPTSATDFETIPSEKPHLDNTIVNETIQNCPQESLALIEANYQTRLITNQEANTLNCNTANPDQTTPVSSEVQDVNQIIKCFKKTHGVNPPNNRVKQIEAQLAVLGIDLSLYDNDTQCGIITSISLIGTIDSYQKSFYDHLLTCPSPQRSIIEILQLMYKGLSMGVNFQNLMENHTTFLCDDPEKAFADSLKITVDVPDKVLACGNSIVNLYIEHILENPSKCSTERFLSVNNTCKAIANYALTGICPAQKPTATPTPVGTVNTPPMPTEQPVEIVFVTPPAGDPAPSGPTVCVKLRQVGLNTELSCDSFIGVMIAQNPTTGKGDIYGILHDRLKQLTNTDTVDELAPAISPNREKIAYIEVSEGSSAKIGILDILTQNRKSIDFPIMPNSRLIWLDENTMLVGLNQNLYTAEFTTDRILFDFTQPYMTNAINPTISRYGSDVWVLAFESPNEGIRWQTLGNPDTELISNSATCQSPLLDNSNPYLVYFLCDNNGQLTLSNHNLETNSTTAFSHNVKITTLYGWLGDKIIFSDGEKLRLASLDDTNKTIEVLEFPDLTNSPVLSISF